MNQLIKTTSDNLDFRLLVAQLDAHLAGIYGEEVAFFTEYNKVDAIKHVVVVYREGKPVGCGGIKAYSDSEMEIKRMFVQPKQRGQGIASDILTVLESWAKELGYSETILETLVVKESVIAMYARNGYALVPNYGQYIGVDSSVCMRKAI
jgi:putative acetyltransferase